MKPLVGMSPPEYSQVAWTEEEVRRLIEQFKIRLVLVLREAQRLPPLPFASELKAGRIPSWLRCVYCDAHILLLRVVDASLPSRSVDESLSGTPAR